MRKRKENDMLDSRQIRTSPESGIRRLRFLRLFAAIPSMPILIPGV
jgi:hypothetical protein